MIIAITRDHCHVVDADDCTRLHATADDLDDDGAGAILERAGLGRAGEAEHVWLAIGALRSAARAVASNPNWDNEFEAMIAFASSKGWTNAAGDHVAAHIERHTGD